jgi:hypothetical protein
MPLSFVRVVPSGQGGAPHLDVRIAGHDRLLDGMKYEQKTRKKALIDAQRQMSSLFDFLGVQHVAVTRSAVLTGGSRGKEVTGFTQVEIGRRENHQAWRLGDRVGKPFRRPPELVRVVLPVGSWPHDRWLFRERVWRLGSVAAAMPDTCAVEIVFVPAWHELALAMLATVEAPTAADARRCAHFVQTAASRLYRECREILGKIADIEGRRITERMTKPQILDPTLSVLNSNPDPRLNRFLQTHGTGDLLKVCRNSWPTWWSAENLPKLLAERKESEYRWMTERGPGILVGDARDTRIVTRAIHEVGGRKAPGTVSLEPLRKVRLDPSVDWSKIRWPRRRGTTDIHGNILPTSLDELFRWEYASRDR